MIPVPCNAINEKNLNSEIETLSILSRTKRLFRTINEKNLNSEIETMFNRPGGC